MAIERILGPFMTTQGEFYYKDKEDSKFVLVRKEQEYEKLITDKKKTRYNLTAVNKEIIKAKKDTDILVSYANSKNARQRDVYPKRSFPTSAKLAKSGDYITRIFAQNKISDTNEIFEVDAVTNATIFKFLSIQWKIGGDIEVAKRYNLSQLNIAQFKMSGIKDILPLDQLHKSKFSELSSTERRPQY